MMRPMWTFALLAQEDARRRGQHRYDPIYDVVAAQTVLERFGGRQAKARPTGSSEVAAVGGQPRHAEGLPGCPTNGQSIGLDGAGGQPGGLSAPRGSTDGIFCN